MTTDEIQAKIAERREKKKNKLNKPIITVKNIINKIESFGYKVKITHYRYFGKRLLKNVDIRVLMKAMKILGESVSQDIKAHGDFVNSRGGLTEVDVFDRDNLFKANANCSLQDNFVYSKASRLALFRVLEQLPDTEARIFRKELEKMYLKYVIQVKENGKWIDYKHPDYSPCEDEVIALDQAKEVSHETGKETKVVSMFD